MKSRKPRLFFAIAALSTTVATQSLTAQFLFPGPENDPVGFAPGLDWLLDPDETLRLPLPGGLLPPGKSVMSRPLIFERNDGQVAPEVAFLSRGRGYSLYLTADEAVVVLNPTPTREGVELLGSRQPSAAFVLHHDADSTAPEGCRTPRPDGNMAVREKTDSLCILRMRLSGANPNIPVLGQQLQRAKANYFIGNDPLRWRTNIAMYGRVKCVGVYPGIDLVYYGNEGRLEYDLVVAPGADPSQIAMEFEGADGLRIQSGGDLVLDVGGQEVCWKKPIVYQEVDGKRIEIAGQFRLQPSPGQSASMQFAANSTPSTKNVSNVERVAFELAAYDPGLPLVIDPILIYSTYLGGSAADGVKDIAIDAQGNAFLAGFTESVDFPTRAPLIGTAPGGSLGNLSTDLFVAKFDPTGELLFSTYLGGSSDEWSDDVNIAVSDTGECHVAGTTASPDFPLANPLQATYGGGDFDAFIAILSADGSSLSFSTYLGGAAWDGAGDIAIGPNRDIFIVGSTGSGDFPTRNAFQAQLSSPSGGVQFSDSFVARLEAGGKSMLYSSYMGSSSTIEKASGLVVDPDGNAYVAVWVNNVSLNRYQYSVAKIRPDGGARLFDRRLPTTMAQQYMFPPYIALVSSNSLAVAGTVAVANLQAVNQPDPSISLGQMESYIALFSATNGAYQSAVYLGGNGSDWVSGLKVDAASDIVVAGYTSGGGLKASGFPVIDPMTSGPDPGKTIDVFVTKFRPPNLTLTQSTLVGGPGNEYAQGMALDPLGRVLVAGYTTGQFPMVDAYQPEIGGGTWDAFLVNLSLRETRVQITRSGQEVTMSWPIEATNYILEATLSLPAVSWTTVTNTPHVTATNRSVQLPLTGPTQFFRLRRP